MAEQIWFNGRVMPMSEARIGVEDRGYQFADGVYEVVRIYNGRCFALRQHLDRLQNSADAISVKIPHSRDELAAAIEQFVADEALPDGMVYLQATRGCAPRNHAYPSCRPTVLFYTRPLPPLPEPGAGAGMKLVTVADERWKKCWIKSIALLANVLAKNEALAAGADEAVFVENGVVTEGATTNLFAVIDGRLVTHPVGSKVLPGITRSAVLSVARQLGIEAVERPPAVEELRDADEVFITATTREILWVSHWNGQQAWPQCGPLTLRLHRALRDLISRDVAERKAARPEISGFSSNR